MLVWTNDYLLWECVLTCLFFTLLFHTLEHTACVTLSQLCEYLCPIFVSGWNINLSDPEHVWYRLHLSLRSVSVWSDPCVSVSLSKSFVSMYMWKCPVYPLVETPSHLSSEEAFCCPCRLLRTPSGVPTMKDLDCWCLLTTTTGCRVSPLYCDISTCLQICWTVLFACTFVCHVLELITSGAMELWINCCAGENRILSIGVWQYSRGACKGDC